MFTMDAFHSYTDKGGEGEHHFVARNGAAQFKKDAAAFLETSNKPQGFDIVFDSLQGDYFQPGDEPWIRCKEGILREYPFSYVLQE